MAGGLVGRRLAVGALRAAVDATAGGVGGVVLLVGDAGMGKTALAAEAVAYAKSCGARAVWASCWEAEGAPGYWPWVQVVRGLLDGDDEPGRSVLDELTGAAGVSSGLIGDDAATRFRTFDVAVTYLRAQAARRPLLVVIDDLHWADVSSLRLLVFLARNVHDAGVLVVGTFRDAEVVADDSPVRALLAELAGQAELVQVTSLTVGEVGELFRKVVGERPPADLVRAVHERTAGNPFFVQQVAQLIAAQDGSSEQVRLGAVPPAVGDVLARRLARLPTRVAELVEAAAVLGRRFAVETAAAVADVSPDAAVTLIDVAVQAGIVEFDGSGAAQFVHDLFREVVYARLPGARRAQLHLAVAQFLEQGAGTAAEIAHHRSAALPLGDRARVEAALVAAGREAAGRSALDEAVAHLGRAVELAGGIEVADLVVACEYADALRRTESREAAKAAFLTAAARARDAGDVAMLAAAAFGAHRVATLTGSSRSDVIALLDEALTAVESADAGTQRWLLSASLARELADGPDRDLPRAVGLAEAAVAGARAAADPGALAYALFALGDVRWEPGTAAERLRIAEDLAAAASAAGETELLLEAQLAKVVARLELGDPAYTSELDEFILLARRAAIPHYLYLARSREATRACLTGPIEVADRLIEDAARYGERIGEPDVWGVESSQLVGLAFLRHDWTRLSALARTRGRPLTPPEFAAHEHGWRLVEAGDLDAAAAVVTAIPDRPAIYRWRLGSLLAGDAELAAAVGHRQRCAALYDQLLPMADQIPVVAAGVFTTGPISLQLGLVCAALERWSDAVAHLEDAVARCNRLGAHLLAERARGELERVLAVRGSRRPEAGVNALHRDGEVWTLAFAGRSAQVRDVKGLRDLAVLLSAPGQEVSAARLAAPDGAAGEPLAALGADPVLDERARTAYRRRLAELDEQLVSADAAQDVERSARLAAERATLIDELARATGLGGRRRRLGDDAERARSTVTARIRDAITRIDRVHPELAAHLRTSISTGNRCSYRPAETVSWAVSQL